MLYNAMEENYELVEVLGERMLFTCSRIDRSSVPAELLGDDSYILPSSLHELFLVGAENRDCDFLKQMVRDANEIVVPKQDYLSDNIYFYSREEQQLKIA